MPKLAWFVLPLLLAGCRVERVAPRAAEQAACADAVPSGELWVYTSMYPTVVDALEALAKEKLPAITLKWFRSGSEKVAQRLEAELASGTPGADVLATSDPFTIDRLARAGRFLPYASIGALRLPRTLVDPAGRHVAIRLSAMALAHRKDLVDPPTSWEQLADPKWRGRVALGDPLASGTAFTWAVFMAERYGHGFFGKLRENGAVVAGGNAAVQQRLETRESDVGVLLEENVRLAAHHGTELVVARPVEGVIVIPGQVAVLAKARNPVAAKAFVDLVLSEAGQRLMLAPGEMHAVDPLLPGPSGEAGVEWLLGHALPWSPAILEAGVEGAARLKDAFSGAFAR